jgi:hypothetical protein
LKRSKRSLRPSSAVKAPVSPITNAPSSDDPSDVASGTGMASLACQLSKLASKATGGAAYSNRTLLPSSPDGQTAARTVRTRPVRLYAKPSARCCLGRHTGESVCLKGGGGGGGGGAPKGATLQPSRRRLSIRPEQRFTSNNNPATRFNADQGKGSTARPTRRWSAAARAQSGSPRVDPTCAPI